MVKDYYVMFHRKMGIFREGQRISYASRVYDEKGMRNLVDSALELWLTSGRYVDEMLSDKTKAMMVAYTLGNPFDLKVVEAFCDKYNLWLIEDNCDSLGSTYEIDEHVTETIGVLEPVVFIRHIT